MGHDARGDGEAERLRLAVQVAQQNPGLGPCGPRFGVHANPLHLPEVDDDPAVAHAQPRVAVAAASHRDELLLISGEANRGDHVRDACTLGNQGWATVDRTVPDPPLLVVRRIVGANQRPAERRREVINRAAVELYATCKRAHVDPQLFEGPQSFTNTCACPASSAREFPGTAVVPTTSSYSSREYAGWNYPDARTRHDVYTRAAAGWGPK